MEVPIKLRLLEKLQIYQTLKQSNSLFRYKRLWRQEKAILIWAYDKRHQHLHSIPNYAAIKEIISQYLAIQIDEVDEVFETIGNLLVKKYVEVSKDGRTIEKNYLPYEEIGGARPTISGILAGEVLSEIENKYWATRIYYRIKYFFLTKIIWFVLILLFIRLVAPSYFEFVFNKLDNYLHVHIFLLPLTLLIFIELDWVMQRTKTD